MLRLILIAFSTLIFASPALSQPCQQLTSISRKERKVLKEYIRFCESKGFLKADTGIVMLHRRIDPLGQLEWYIGVSYKDYYIERKPPIGWSTVLGKPILWYNDLFLPNDPKLTNEEQTCLAQVVGTRVSKRPPPPQPRPILDINGQPMFYKNGRPMMTSGQDFRAGGSGVDMHIIFKKDGSVSKLISV
ncbi:hypothetical protein [Spirosoma horti]|jgi:hypothetical protein